MVEKNELLSNLREEGNHDAQHSQGEFRSDANGDTGQAAADCGHQRNEMLSLVTPLMDNAELTATERIVVKSGGMSPWCKYSHALSRMIPIRRNKQSAECPFEYVGLFSMLTFHWIQPLMWRIYKHGLHQRDIWPCPKQDAAADNAARLEKLWENCVGEDGDRASLWRVLWRFCRTRVYVSLVALFIQVIISFLGPAFAFRKLLQLIGDPESSFLSGLLFACLLAFTELLRTFSTSIFFTLNYQTGVRIQGAVTTIVYQKLLRLRHLQDKTAGDFVNLFSSDAHRLSVLVSSGLNIVAGPLITVLALVYLCIIIGPTVFIGFSVVLIFYPLQIVLSRIINTYRSRAVVITDRRVRLMNEVLTYIKLIKMYAWEAPFAQAVSAIRGDERRVLEQSQFIKSLLLTLVPGIPTIAVVLTLIAHTQLGYRITVPEAFTLLAVLNCVRPKLSTVPTAVHSIAEAKVAADRFEQILRMAEATSNVMAPSDVTTAVLFEEAWFAWDAVPQPETDVVVHERRTRLMSGSAGGGDIPSPVIATTFNLIRSNASHLSEPLIDPTSVECLRDLNISIKKGALIGVCGKYGSGKSSLLCAMLGQMKLLRGKVSLSDSVAYVAQQAFIFNGTVRDNVLFGLPFEKDKYDRALVLCQLLDDLRSLPSGDNTEIGERGINLSGGQKQRISLARAIYSNREILLLDDVLSAVDVRVGNAIFTDCIKSGLATKTVILVTHQLQYLEQCDDVLYIRDGRLVEQGSHESLMRLNGFYRRLIETYHRKDNASEEDGEQDDEVDDDDDDDDDDVVTSSDVYCEENGQPLIATTTTTTTQTPAFTSVTSVASDTSELATGNNNIGCLIESENRRHGHVTREVYWAYVQSAGGICAVLVICCVFMVNVACTGVSNWWLSHWLSTGRRENSSATHDDRTAPSDGISDNSDLWFYNSIHAGILAAIMLTGLIRSMLVMKATLHASSSLHDQLFRQVFSGPITFFDTTPTGRILNRFARDLDDVDTNLPTLMESSSQNICQAVLSVVVISIVFPYFLMAVLPLLLIYMFVQRIFRSSLREIKRLESLSRSPLLSHIACSVQGLYTLRPYDKYEEYVNEYRRLQDANSILNFLHDCAKRWLTIRLDLVANFVVLFTAVLAVLLRRSIGTAYAGLALTYAVQMTGLLQFGLRMALETESVFTSVERLVEYIQKIQPEGQLTGPTKTVPQSWPHSGSIVLENVRLRYRPGLPSVLRDISVRIGAGEKIGIVGRTGSGKSSLCVALFRLVELTSGSITIDDTDVSQVSLHDLRSRLAIIPQDPVLFAGSLRYNLDPFNKHSDEDIWSALYHCRISAKIKSLPGKLNFLLVENGSNFSVGERQLICLARALLRNSKILVMDEATASVDAATDILVQETIAEAFSRCTVLTIAHRLNTVCHCDKIMVLKRGKLLEFDTPSNLLANPDSAFSHMTHFMDKDLTQGDRSDVS